MKEIFSFNIWGEAKAYEMSSARHPKLSFSTAFSRNLGLLECWKRKIMGLMITIYRFSV